MNELAHLVAPFTPESFVREVWNRRSIHLKGVANRFPFHSVLGSWERGDGLTELRAAAIDERGQQVEQRIDATMIAPLFRSGMTICADASEHPAVKPYVAGVVRELRIMGGRGFAKLYASADDRGFAVHVDSFHVFVVQLEGRKRWRFGRTPAVPSSLHGGALDPEGRPVFTFPGQGPMFASHGVPAPRPDALDEVVLEPGDVLYLPPGTWHVARAIERSVAISISPPRAPIAKLLLAMLEEQLLERPEWREDVLAPPGERGATGHIEPTVAAQFSARTKELAALLERFDQRALHRAFRLNLRANEASVAQAIDVSPETRLCHPTGAPFEFLLAPTPEGEAVVLHREGVEFALPLAAEPFMRAIAERPTFVAKEAPAFAQPPLSWVDTKALLDQLVAAGLLAQAR